MKKFFTFLKIEGLLSLRCPDGLIFGVGMPVGVMMLIAAIGGNQRAGGSALTFMESAFASLLTVGICATAFMGIPLTIATYRDKKILKHFFVTPASPVLMLAVPVCIAMFTAIGSAVLIAVVAVFGFGYEMKGNPLWFIGAYFLVMISMYSVGMVIASVCRTVKICNVVTTFVYFPMLFLSGATIPYELFPKFIQTVAEVLPLTHGIKLLKELSVGSYGSQNWTSFIILTIFAVVGCTLSVVSFRWE